MKKVVVGFNGSEESLDALLLAKQFARAEGAELHVAAVVWETDRSARQQRFDGVFSQARRELGAQQFVEQPLEDGSPPQALHDLAEELRPDLIVIGSTHRGKIGRIVIGSVGERLLRGAPCSVAVAPRGYARHEHVGLGLIGVGYDGSPEAKLALKAAARLAPKLDCSLRLISVVPELVTPGRISGTDSGYEVVLADEFREILEEGGRTLGKEIEAKLVLEHGDPAKMLADQGVELDLLVVGSRGYGPLRRTVLGGVSADVMRLAPCPVLITPRSSENAGVGDARQAAAAPQARS